MKKYITLLSAFMFGLTAAAQSTDWLADKYSMFIHFGLYSHFGGVYDGEPVRQGYSEQIQSFAGIFSDWYAAEAREFDPAAFDADQIAALAKDGGMRSIVFTSKHHDGFCMFDTKTTSYSSVAMMPSHRDFVRELSQACERHGLRFGLYFSLIDWNYPHAYPISSHNADFITPEHHEFNKAQVMELLTNYGPISELWFDMGSLQPQQSRELYDLVKEIQPDCMVSGRLGNDFYDFAVMADNRLPESALQALWQSAASMFPETWSYRSWQERGSVEDKYAEKLRTLINVVAHGGNYLLNIGPASDGSIVPFEAEVIRLIGRWLDDNGEAIYGTSPSPFRSNGFEWGHITVKDNVMYLLLTGVYPEEGLKLYAFDGLTAVEGAGWNLKDSHCEITVTPDMFGSPDVKVIRMIYDRPVESFFQSAGIYADEVLSWQNASPDYSYSCFDYYSNYRSTVGYGWNVGVRRPVSSVELTYTSEDIGRRIRLEVGDMSLDLTLGQGEEVPLENYADLDSLLMGRMRGGTFDNPVSFQRVREWVSVEEGPMTVPSEAFANYLWRGKVAVKNDSRFVFDVTSGNGVEVMVDGRTMMKHLNPYRTVGRTEKVLMDLSEGVHEVTVRSYNRFEDCVQGGMALADDQRVYRMKVTLPYMVGRGAVPVKISASDSESEHKDCGLHNIRLRFVR